MNIEELIKKKLNDFDNRNIQLWTEDGKLKFRAAAGLLTAQDKEFLKSNKAAIIDCLQKDNVEVVENKEDMYKPFELTEIQQAYVLGRNRAFAYGGTACHIYLEFKYDKLDHSRVELIWNQIIARHPMLRATMSVDGYQKVHENLPEFKVEHRIYSDEISAGSGRDEIKKEYDHKIYDTEVWPLFTVIQSTCPENDMLHISIEFVTADWTSIWTILSEFEALYFEDKKELPELKLTFRDYLITEKKIRQGSKYYRDREYWMERIDTIPSAPELPRKQEKDDGPVRFERNCFKIDKNDWDSFCKTARAYNVTPVSAVIGVYAYVLSKWSTNKDFCLNLSILNRLPVHPNVGEIVGDFTSSNLLETSRKKDVPFYQYVQSINQRLFDDLDHKLFTGVNVIRELQQRRTGDVLMPYVFTGAIGLIDHEKSKLRGKMTDRGISQTAQVFLDCQAMDTADGLNINLDSRRGIFPDGLMKDFADVMKETLLRLAANPSTWEKEEPHKELPEWQQDVLLEVNNTEKNQKLHRIHETVISSIRSNPDKVYVVDSEAEWTGRDLWEVSCKVAGELKKYGVKKGDFIGVAVVKSRWQIAACLGILSVGAAYVPISPDQGVERCIKILNKVKAPVVIARSTQKENELFEKYTPLYIDDLKASEFDYERDGTLVELDDPAYIIFTSGSTGEPKGVEISHRAAVNTIEAVNELFDINETDRAFQISQLNFDLSVYDLFGVLGAGGSIVIPDSEQYKNPAHWAQLMQRYHITVWNSVPALMQLLLIYKNYNMDIEFSPMKVVLLSGDWIPMDMPGKIKEAFAGAKVISLGGATEGGIWSIYHDCDEEVPGFSSSIPYGKPLYNQGFCVLDNLEEECPIWVPGELGITGDSLATSYYGDHSLTEKAFVTLGGKRVYKTGDIGCYHPDGNIEFLGRIDNQVKIRGHRIELGEIETIMKSEMGLGQVRAVVIDTDGEKKLAALAVSDKSYNDKELIELLSRYLPAYMIPSICVATQEIPLTGNGKVDIKAAVEIIKSSMNDGKDQGSKEEAMDELELKIQKIILENLGVTSLGLNDDFYEMGANSLILARVAGQLNNTIESKATFDSYLIQLLNGPTVKQVADFVRDFAKNEDKENGSEPVKNEIEIKEGNSDKNIVVFRDHLSDEVMNYVNKDDKDTMILVPNDIDISSLTSMILAREGIEKIQFIAADTKMSDCMTVASEAILNGIVPERLDIIESDSETESDESITYMGDISFGLVYTPMNQSNELKDILGETCLGEIELTDCSDEEKIHNYMQMIFDL